MGGDAEILTEHVQPLPPLAESNIEKLAGQLFQEHRRRYEGSSRIWKRFAVLPKVEGQKYTIGEKFTSREEQGEFIFLTREQLGKLDKKGDPLVEILYLKGKFWVTPKGGNGTFINGKKIGKKTALKFGDNLSFKEKPVGLRREDDGGNGAVQDGPEIVRFCFKERELVSDDLFPSLDLVWDMTRQEVKWQSYLAGKDGQNTDRTIIKAASNYDSASAVGQNDLLVSHILTYFTVHELKQSKLVSRVWNRESNKVLTKRGALRVCGVRPMYFFLYSQDMKNTPLPHWLIAVPSFRRGRDEVDTAEDHLEALDHTEGKPGAKWISDLNWFLNTQFHAVKSLVLHGHLSTKLEFELRIKIMEKLSSTLEELELSGRYQVLMATRKFKFPATLTFPKLQRLTIRIQMRARVAQEYIPQLDTWILSWMTPLVKSVQGVKALILNESGLIECKFLQDLRSFPNLEELSLSHTDKDSMRWLVMVERPFKKLVLNKLIGFTQVDVPIFEELLIQQSKSLETLSFHPITKGVAESLTIKFPPFIKLKYLEVGRPAKVYDKERGHSSLPITLKFGEEDGIISYVRDFPLLQSLTLHPFDLDDLTEEQTMDIDEYWRKHSGFFENFFPLQATGKINPSSKSLLVLNIPFQRGADTDRLFLRGVELFNMFPNVINSWTNSVYMHLKNKSDPQTENRV